MASPITIKQRVSIDSSGRRLRISQNQNGRIRNSEIELKEPVRRVRQLANITDYADQWPKTELDVNTPEFQENQKPSE